MEPKDSGHSGAPLRVVVVDDHYYIREGLTLALEDDPKLKVVGKFETAEDALKAFPRLHADVAVFDYRLPGISGADACRLVNERKLRTRTVILTSFDRDPMVTSSYESGANGFVVKSSDPTFLLEAIHAVAAGSTYIDPAVTRRLVKFATPGHRIPGPFGLSVMELRVIQRLPLGLTARQIGSQLGIGAETARSHIKNACAKLDVQGGKEALLEDARKKGLV